MTTPADTFETVLYGENGKPSSVAPGMRRCIGCDTTLPPQSRGGRARKWCSDRCRKNTLYADACVDCGKLRYTGGQGERSHPRCTDCQAEHIKHNPAARRTGKALTWTDSAIFKAIRSVAVKGVVSVTMYDAAYRANPGTMPSRPTILKRFDLWSEAVTRAGCETTRSVVGPYVSRFPVEGLLLAVDDCWEDLGHPPTYAEYDAWAHLQGVPSAQTVRNRMGTWRKTLEAVQTQRASDPSAA